MLFINTLLGRIYQQGFLKKNNFFLYMGYTIFHCKERILYERNLIILQFSFIYYYNIVIQLVPLIIRE